MISTHIDEKHMFFAAKCKLNVFWSVLIIFLTDDILILMKKHPIKEERKNK